MRSGIPLKVAFCLHDSPDSLGGPHVWAERLLPALNLQDLDLTALLFTPGGEARGCATTQTLQRAGIACRFCDFRQPIRRRIRWILEQCQQLQPDVLVANFQIEAWYATRWLNQAGIPVLGVVHSDDDYYNALLNLSVWGPPRWRVAGIVAVSSYLTDKVHQGNASMPVWRIPCGVPIPATTVAAPDKVLRIAYVGRLIEYQKRISSVAEAFCRVTQKSHDVECLIIGDGPERSRIESLIAERGCRERVRVLGKLDSAALPDVLATCHVITLLSDYEGVPVALMEAMALGIVPVCLEIRSGIPELVEQEVSGLLLSDRNDSFDSAIQRLKQDRHLWQRLSENARALIQHRFSLLITEQQWVDCLHQVAAFGRPMPQPARPLQPLCLRLPPGDPALHWGDPRPMPWREQLGQRFRLLRFELGMLRQRLRCLGRQGNPTMRRSR